MIRDFNPPYKRLPIGTKYIQWDDTMASAGLFTTGVSSLTFDTLAGGIKQYRFDVNDEVHIPAIQFPHGILEGCTISPHLHIINKAATAITSPPTVQNIAFEFEYGWVNIGAVMPAIVSETITYNVGGLAALTHKVIEFTDIVPAATQGKISSCFICRLKRVAAASNAYNTANIFTFGFDLHFQRNTLGSRTEYAK
jgi:hypothetical protein